MLRTPSSSRGAAQRLLRLGGGSCSSRKRPFSSVLGGIQSAVESLHAATGTPWWLTLSLATVGARSCMLPAVWVQGRAQGRLAAAMPDIRMVWQAYSAAQRGTKAMEVAERAENVKLLLAGLRAAVGVHQVSPIQTMLAPLVNIPVFMCFVFAIRDLIASRGLELGLAQGGAFWFVDLTTRDTSLALPLGAIALSYASIEAGLGRVESGPLRAFKNFMQTCVILALPVATQLPCGVMCYWIPSSMFSLAQTLSLRSPAVRSAVGLASVRQRHKQSSGAPPPSKGDGS